MPIQYPFHGYWNLPNALSAPDYLHLLMLPAVLPTCWCLFSNRDHSHLEVTPVDFSPLLGTGNKTMPTSTRQTLSMHLISVPSASVSALYLDLCRGKKIKTRCSMLWHRSSKCRCESIEDSATNMSRSDGWEQWQKGNLPGLIAQDTKESPQQAGKQIRGGSRADQLHSGHWEAEGRACCPLCA